MIYWYLTWNTMCLFVLSPKIVKNYTYPENKLQASALTLNSLILSRVVISCILGPSNATRMLKDVKNY